MYNKPAILKFMCVERKYPCVPTFQVTLPH